MPAIAAVAIPAAVGVASAIMKNKSEAAARKAAASANQQALTHTTSRESIEDQRYQQRWDDFQRRHAAWEARQFGGAQSGGSQPTNMSPVAVSARNAVMQPGYSAQPQTLRDIASASTGGFGATPDQAGSMADASTGQGGTLRDLSEWNDWRSKGLGV